MVKKKKKQASRPAPVDPGELFGAAMHESMRLTVQQTLEAYAKECGARHAAAARAGRAFDPASPANVERVTNRLMQQLADLRRGATAVETKHFRGIVTPRDYLPERK